MPPTVDDDITLQKSGGDVAVLDVERQVGWVPWPALPPFVVGPARQEDWPGEGWHECQVPRHHCLQNDLWQATAEKLNTYTDIDT